MHVSWSHYVNVIASNKEGNGANCFLQGSARLYPFYRPCTKYEEGNIYTWECLSVDILGGGALPSFSMGGTPIFGENRVGTASLGRRGVPPIGTGWGTPCGDYMEVPHPCKNWKGVPPSRLDGITPPSTGCGYPHQDWMGCPPPHHEAERALATQRTVCLLRSFRRTFLFSIAFWITLQRKCNFFVCLPHWPNSCFCNTTFFYRCTISFVKLCT